MIPPQQAETLILQQTVPLDPETDRDTVDLLAANGRILAATVTSDLDFPHWDNSAMDGYAVRFADVEAIRENHPATLTVVETIPAGYQPQQTIQPGQAARIFTGSVMPAGADTIVIQENTKQEGDRVTILTAPQPKAFVRHRASFYRAGEPLLSAGMVLGSAEIAVLAAAQCPTVPVFRRPRVAILSTGNELVTPDQPLQPGQIVDSNQYALAALVQSVGAEPICLGIVRDEPETLRGAIAQALTQADLILSSGGVSVGDYDYVDQILADLEAEIHIRAVAVKPGKPLTVATFPALSRPILYFGLPGNPASALVGFWRFVAPALRKLSGRQSGWEPVFIQGRSPHELRAGGQRETYLWGQLQVVNGDYEFHLAGGSHSSGNLINLAQTNALAVLPIGTAQIPAGGWVQVMLLGGAIA
ncbi:MAG: gephyrin-like molybdotransferase Glp [Synechococcales bacterium]|nr:gephyrin-like molybdotransferase Glp [Synechococcales bacterium]